MCVHQVQRTCSHCAVPRLLPTRSPQAPDDITGVFTQRLRWAMGALQILLRDNPLKAPGLTWVQGLLFWEAAAYHFLAIITIVLALVPVVYVFSGVAPLIAPRMWEFSAAFCTCDTRRAAHGGGTAA